MRRHELTAQAGAQLLLMGYYMSACKHCAGSSLPAMSAYDEFLGSMPRAQERPQYIWYCLHSCNHCEIKKAGLSESARQCARRALMACLLPAFLRAHAAIQLMAVSILCHRDARLPAGGLQAVVSKVTPGLAQPACLALM